MDFHGMKRKELQRLCKEHDIPANLSNFDMVDKLSSLLKVQEKEGERPMRKTRSCLKNCDEMLSENESDVLKRKLKKVRFSPQNDVFQLGEKSERGFVVENKGGAGRVTRCRAKLAKTIMISPVVMKKRGRSAVQEVEKEDLVVENKGGASRVTRARASLGKSVVISSPVVMKKRGKRALHEDEKGNLAVENNVGASRVTRARALLGEKVLTSPVVTKKRGKKAVQENEKEDLVVENKGGASRVTRARAGKQVLISSPVIMKKRGKKAVQDEKKSGSASSLVVDFTSPAVEEEKEVITVKFLRSRKVENVVSPKNIARNRSQGVNAEVSENKDAEADGGITKTRQMRQSKRNRMEFTQVEPLEENLGATEKAGRRNITRSRNQFQAKASNIGGESETRYESEEAKEVVFQVKEPSRRSGRHVNTEHTDIANDSEMPIKSDESTRYQTRHGTKRMSVMPQMKKAKTEKPVASNLGKKNFVVKDSPNESAKSIVPEKSSETGHIRRSKRSASGDASLVISEDADGSGTDIKTGTPKKRRRDAVLEEVPSQHTGRRVNRKTDGISDKLEEETPVASGPRTRSGNRQDSLMPSAKKLNMSGNLGPSRTTGEKASPHHKREHSTVPKHSATGVRQSKTVAVTPRTRSGSGQKSFIQTAKKLRISGKSGLHKTIGNKESPHQSREFSVVPRRSETESKVRGSKSKQTPVINEHPRRFTRSALKGKTDGPAHVRGKIYQKKSQSVSKLPLSKVESSLPKVISASEGPLDIDVQSSDHEADRSTVNLVLNASDLPVDKTACSTPYGGSAKTSGVDLNVQESEGPELINIHEASSSYPSKLQIDHAELRVDISARGHASVERPASYDVQSSIPQIAGCSTDPISDASNSCWGIDSCAILQDSATEANDRTPVHVKPAEVLDVAGDVAFINRNSVDDGFSSLEQMTSKGMEVSPQTLKYVEPSSEGITNVVLEGSTVREDQSMNQLLFPEDGCSTIPLSQTGDVNEDNTTATQQENSCESNVASPPLVHLKADDAAGDAFPVDTNALADISLVDQSTSTRDKERPQLSKDVESISKGIDHNLVFQGPKIHEDDSVYQSPLAEVEEITDNSVTGNSDAACVTQQEGLTEIDHNLVFQGPTIHEDDSVYQSPLAEVEEITDNSVTGNSDAACVTQQEGLTEIDAKSPSLVHLKSADKVDIIGDAGSIDAGSVDYLFNVKQINLSAIKEEQEVSKNVNHVVAEGSTVNEEKLSAEVGDCGPTEQEKDIRNYSAEFSESGVDKDFADLTNQTASMIFTEEKDDTMHPEMSVEADETPNTSSKSGMQEKEFPVPKSILTTEGVSILEYEFSKQEFSDTVMCSNKEIAEDSNQRLSNVESCLMRGESCTNKCVEFSTSEVVADSVVRVNSKPEPKDISSPLHVTEVGNLVVEVNEELKPEDSPSNRSSDIFERAAADGSSLRKEQCSFISADVSEHNQSKNANDESEISKKASALDSSSREMCDVPEFISSLTSNVTEVGHLLEEVKEQKPEDPLSLWGTKILPERAAEDGSSLYKEHSSVILADGSEHNQPECAREESEIKERVNMLDSTTRESTDMPECISVSQTPDYNIGGKCTEIDLISSSISSKKMVAFKVDGSSLRKEQCYVISADVSEHNQSKNANDESEISKKASAPDSSSREMCNVPEFISSLTSNVTEVGHLLEEVKEQKPEDSLSLWGTKILPERAAEDGSSLHKEHSSVILADGSEHNQPECAREESEIRERVNMLDSTTRESTDMPECISVSQTPDYNIGGKCTEIDISSSSISSKKMVAFKVDTDSSSREMCDVPEFISSLTSNVTEVGHLLEEVKEQKPEDSLSLWGTKILPERAAEDGSSLYKEHSSVILADGSEHNQPECAREESEIKERVNMLDSTTRESTDMPECISVSQTPDYNIGGKCTEIDLISSSISSKKMVAFKVDGSSLRKEQCYVISADVSEHNQSKNANDESEISKKASAPDSLSREMCNVPEFISSLTSNVTEVGHLLEEVKEQKPEDSLSLWGTKILPERAAEDGSSLHKEHSSVILADGSEHNQPECAREESEIRERVNMLDSTTRESTDMPECISVSQTPDYNIGGKCTEIDLSSSSISSKKMVAFKVDTDLTSKGQEECGAMFTGQEDRAVAIEGSEVEETVFEDNVKIDSERTSGMYFDAHNILDGQLPTVREWDSEDMTFSISGDVEERMNKNVSRERTPVISKDDVDIDGTSCPVIVHKFLSDVDDHCHTPSEDSCGKEQGTNMSMVKSSRNFGKQFSSQQDYCLRPLKDSCGKEQGTPMSMVKSSKNCGEEFSSQHDNIIEQVKVCSAAALPQTISEDFAGFDNQLVADLMGSTGRRISRTGALNNEKLEETEPCTVITDKIVLEGGIELLKGNSSNLIQNLVEDSGGYFEKSDIEIITYDVSEEDRYCKDTIDSHRSEDALQQFDMNDGETDSKVKGICQENDETPILFQMDVDTNNVESSRDNLIAIQVFDQESDASGVPTKELPRNEDAMDSDALANLQYGGDSVTLTAQTNEAQGVLTEEFSRIEEAMVANAPANLQYGHEGLTLTGDTNEAQEHKSRSDEIDGDESQFWYENTTSFILDKSEVSGKEVDIFAVSPTEQQMHDSGEEHAREKCPESIEIQHEAFNNPGTGDDHISGGNSVGTLNGTQLESEASKDAHQKVDCYSNNRFDDEDFTRTES